MAGLCHTYRTPKARALAPHLVIFVKEPVAGRVKTRLARDIGVVRATQFFRQNMSTTIARLGGDRRWRTILAIAPDAAIASRMFEFQSGGRAPERMKQGAGDLGARLARAVRTMPAGPIVIIGADIPGIRAKDIASAFQALRGADAVFGPSGDGGYWLVGFSARARQTGAALAFNDVRWSTALALADTRANLADFDVRDIGAKDDVDDGGDFARLSPLIGRRVVYRAGGRSPALTVSAYVLGQGRTV